MADVIELTSLIDPAEYRRVLGHFSSGVAIVTAIDGNEPVGMAVNSFTSVSLDPPLVLFCAAKSSTTWPRMARSGHFCVNVLADDQENVCRLFATKGADRFSAVGWSSGVSGAPILGDALAWIECQTFAEHDAGDHVVVIGRVVGLDGTGGEPLIFYRGDYRNLG